MRNNKRNARTLTLIGLTGLAVLAGGCELVVDFDRTKIDAGIPGFDDGGLDALPPIDGTGGDVNVPDTFHPDVNVPDTFRPDTGADTGPKDGGVDSGDSGVGVDSGDAGGGVDAGFDSGDSGVGVDSGDAGLPIDAGIDAGGAPALTFSPVSPIDFGTHPIGVAGTPVTITITNTGTAATPAPLVVAIAGANAADFVKSNDTCSGATLAVSANCTLDVTFTPSTTAAETATLDVTGGATGSATLNGTGTSGFTVAPAAGYDFGDVATGETTAALAFVFTNTGSISETPSVTLTGTDAAQFTISTNGCTAPVAAGASCTVDVEFTPSTMGAKVAAIQATPGNAGNSAPLSGTALAAGTGLTIAPTTNDYGTITVGNMGGPATFTVTNNDATNAATIATLGLSGTDAAQYSITGGTCAVSGMIAAAGGTCTIAVTFTPTSVGKKYASLAIGGTINAATVSQSASQIGTGG